MDTHSQGTTLFTLILVLIGTIVVVQLWILSASLDAFLQRDMGALVPAAVASFVLLGLNGALLRHVLRFDARLRHRGPRG